MECIVLAGGLGTRLQHIVPDLPKCLAPVNGQPFLAYILRYLESQFCDHVILSLGYKHEMVLDWLKTKAFTFKVSWVIEDTPLGTGGGIKKAIQKCKSNDCFVLNGDTLFEVPLATLPLVANAETKAVIALKPMKDFERYGTVMTDEEQTIVAFKEKQACHQGNINGGIYWLPNAKVNFAHFPEVFSFESDFFEQEADKGTLKAITHDQYFIDIGVAEDYARAQVEIK